MKKKKITDYFVLLFCALIVGHFFIASFVIGKDVFEFLDLRVLDVLQTKSDWKKKSDIPVLVVADTKAIDRIGRWPWSRDIIAEIIRNLNEYYEVNSIGLDIVFSEPDKNFTFLKKNLKEFRTEAQEEKKAEGVEDVFNQQIDTILAQSNTDKILGDELKRWDNIVTGYLFFSKSEDISHLKSDEINKSAKRVPSSNLIVIKESQQFQDNLINEAGFLEANIPEISSLKSKSGFFNIVSEKDGVVRKIPLFFKFSGRYFESLDLILLRQYLGFEGDLAPVELYLDETGASLMKVNGESYRINRDGTVWINYKGPEKTYDTFSMYDILQKTIPKDKLKDKIVYMGVTEVGVFDIRPTPVSSFFPGVEVHTNVLDNLLQKDYLIHDQGNLLVDLVLILVFSVICLVVLNRFNVFVSFIILTLLLIAYISVNIWMIFNIHTWYNFYAIFFLVIGSIMVNTFRKYYFEGKEKKFIRNTFDRYLSPVVIDRIIEEPDRVSLGGENKNISILFSDIESFTTLSEKLQVEELIRLLNEYLTNMTDLVFVNQGTIDKYVGDAIVAFYGAPLPLENHEAKAAITAVQMQNFLRIHADAMKEEFGWAVRCRVGVNTGNAIVGNVGSAQRMDYTVIGDSVNLAARLEATNKQYGTNVLVSDTTWQAAESHVEGRKIDIVKVKGKSQATSIYELQALKGELNPDKMEANEIFNEAMQHYEQQNFAKALELFMKVYEKNKDTVAQIFVNRCVRLHKEPPGENWDKVYPFQAPPGK